MKYTLEMSTIPSLYVYLVDDSSLRPARQARTADGIVIDLSEAGQPLGVEILDPDPDIDLSVLEERFGLTANQVGFLRFVISSGLQAAIPIHPGTHGSAIGSPNTVDTDDVGVSVKILVSA